MYFEHPFGMQMPGRHGFATETGDWHGSYAFSIPPYLFVDHRLGNTPLEYVASQTIELSNGFLTGAGSDNYVAYIADSANMATLDSAYQLVGNGYRYGFNGKEKDDEVKGEGNELDYGMRIQDTRSGRFLSVDPLTRSYPMLTPYQFASNSPILSVDLDGAESVEYYKISHHYKPVSILGHLSFDLANSTLGKTSSGAVHGLSSTLKGYYQFYTHDIGQLSTWQNMGRFLEQSALSMSTVKVYGTPMIDAKSDEFINAIIKGDAYSRANYITNFATNAFVGYLIGKSAGATVMLAKARLAQRFFVKAAQNIEVHLSRQMFLNANGEIEAGNQIMIDRIRKIAKGDLKATPTDINFVNHELTEKSLMDKKGLSYEEAHQEALKKHGYLMIIMPQRLYTLKKLWMQVMQN